MKKLLPLFILLVSLLSIVGITQTVTARSINMETGTTVTISEDSDGALAVSGQDIVVEGNVNGALFVAGNSITIKGDVNGPLFVAGNAITIEGTIEGEVFIAGNTIRIAEETDLSRDAFIVGSEILINGTVGRDLYSGNSKTEINNAIGRNAHLYTDTLTFTENAVVGGNLFYASDTEVTDINQYVEGEVRYEETTIMNRRSEMSRTTLLRRISNVLGALLSASIIWWTLRNLTHKWWFTLSQKSLNRPIFAMLIGLGLLLLVPIIVILAFISRILGGIGLLLLILYILVLFLTRIITASILGKYMLEHRLPFKKHNDLISFLGAYLLLHLAGMVPIVGGLITFLSIIYAVGIVFNELLYRMETSPI